ncbi:oligosaccharide flippase family protein [Vibrio metschnikovii]|uniref:oligosaccharide flippase family protein n=1 Tax=Vibrio metschnikovii TaxID=28172 RepID=UPI002A56EF3B|nr:oligosaccharide flippase family protein [Vibrio metschnikovii]EKO3789896.1 oligosaccharide flippase family protein [Vibrio metschnikovii]
MLTKLKKLSQSKFVRNVAIVATGTAGAQAITMAFSPIITRLYGPEAFGLLGTFMAILAIATPIAALTYPIAIVLPKSDCDALGIAKLSAFLAFIMSGLLAVIILILGDSLAVLLSIESIAGFLWLIPVAMLFAAFQQILQQWLIRKKQFKITAKVAVMQALMINSAKVGIGWFNPIGTMLIILATVGNALHALLLWAGLRKQPAAFVEEQENQQAISIKELAKRHKDFPLFRAPQVAINALSQGLPVLMLASFFGPASAGFYTLGKTVVGIPSALIGKSVGDVFYPRITTAAHNKENLFQLIFKSTLVLAAIGLIPFAIVIIFGPRLFAFVFGADWIVAGEYARWMALWMYFGFLNRPSVAAIATLRMQDIFLIYEILSVLMRMGSLYIGFLIFSDDIIAVMYFSITGVFLNSFLVLYTLINSRYINFV